MTTRGCGGFLGLGYVAIIRLLRYSTGLRAPREILIRFSLYQRMYESRAWVNWSMLVARQSRLHCRAFQNVHDFGGRLLLSGFTRALVSRVPPRRSGARDDDCRVARPLRRTGKAGRRATCYAGGGSELRGEEPKNSICPITTEHKPD